MRRLLLVLAVAALVGCGGEDGGTATLWVTRDRGAHVLVDRKVPSGLTAMQALDRVADIETRYGGRYVHAINGIEGSLADRRDWFYFINGYDADRSAAEYRLRPGDVEWWDFRSWRTRMREPVVVGAFPEPFLHGYGGETRRACVVGRPRRAVAILKRLLHAGESCDGNVLVLKRGKGERFWARTAAAGDRVTFTYVGDPMRLARNPRLARFRYALP